MSCDTRGISCISRPTLFMVGNRTSKGGNSFIKVFSARRISCITMLYDVKFKLTFADMVKAVKSTFGVAFSRGRLISEQVDILGQNTITIRE